MRFPFSSTPLNFLQYQIREIVQVAKQMQALAPELNFTYENIGDPIAKGWQFPEFAKQILLEEINRPGDKVFGYTHSWGKEETREWVVRYAKDFCPTNTLTTDDVVFTNGLGAAIGILYQMLPASARILQPSPAYPTHTSFESFHAEAPPLFYHLDPTQNWQPDVSEIEEMVRTHPEITGILIINPNNPTGAVYTRETLEKIVAVAEKNNLFLLSDEIYFRLVYGDQSFVHLTELCQGRVPLIVMRGASKDIPWPGSRAGWLEFHNTSLDVDFARYVEVIKRRILLEVCSTTLPQTVIPKIYSHPDFSAWLTKNNQELRQNSQEISAVLGAEKSLRVNPTVAAFYMMPIFEPETLTAQQTLPIANPQLRQFVETLVQKPGLSLDQRFVYYLLAATGICVVPASGFYSTHLGFRITTLDRDEERRQQTYTNLVRALREYTTY